MPLAPSPAAMKLDRLSPEAEALRGSGCNGGRREKGWRHSHGGKMRLRCFAHEMACKHG